VANLLDSDVHRKRPSSFAHDFEEYRLYNNTEELARKDLIEVTVVQFE